jgi:hypothetical protein
MSGGLVAILAMAAFLPFALFVARRLPRALAVAVVVVAGSVFLPEGAVLLDLPIVPAIEKERVTFLSALVIVLVFFRKDFLSARPALGLESVFILIFIGYLFTTAQNRLPVVNYGTTFEGLGIYWILARSIDDFLTFVLPFLIGRTMFRSESDLRALAYVLVGAGLIYVPLIIIEALLSIPFSVWQLHYVIYGIAMQPSWRWGGIQPVVFMENALSNASFMAMVVIMAAGFAAGRSNANWFGATRAHLLSQLGLLLTRVTSSNIYGIVFGVMLRVARARLSALMATGVALAVCVYPAMRLADVFPDERLVEIAAKVVNEERAFSLQGRFLEEDFVFAGLGERLWFGWGMYDRIPDAANFGEGETGLDSFLVIRVGLTGIIGTELILLLMLVPVLIGFRRFASASSRESRFLLVALMLCVAARMVDSLLNDIWNCLPFFLAGALQGISRSISSRPAGGIGVAMREAGRERSTGSQQTTVSRRSGRPEPKPRGRRRDL